MKKIIRMLTASVIFGLAASPFMPGTAANAGHFHSTVTPAAPCVQTSLAGGVVSNAGGGAVDASSGDELEFSTGLSNDDYARWRKNLVVPIKLSSLTELKYTVTKTDSGPNPAAAPALRLYLKDGAEEYTIVHEPYYQSGGNLTKDVARTENALTGKWWSGKDIGTMVAAGGGAYATNKTIAEINAPPTVMIVGFGFQVGTYNQGTTGTVKNLSLKASEACAPPVQPSTSASSASPAPSSSASTTPVAVPTLPVTGTRPYFIAASGAIALFLGVVLIVAFRKKKEQ